MLKTSAKRIILRIAHLVAVIPVLGYISFIQKRRYLDKLVDELAKGKKMEKILRKAES